MQYRDFNDHILTADLVKLHDDEQAVILTVDGESVHILLADLPEVVRQLATLPQSDPAQLIIDDDEDCLIEAVIADQTVVSAIFQWGRWEIRRGGDVITTAQSHAGARAWVELICWQCGYMALPEQSVEALRCLVAL